MGDSFLRADAVETGSHVCVRYSVHWWYFTLIPFRSFFINSVLEVFKVPLVVAKKMPSDESFIVREEFEKRYRYLEN